MVSLSYFYYVIFIAFVFLVTLMIISCATSFRTLFKEHEPQVNKVYIINSINYGERFSYTRKLCEEMGFYQAERIHAIYPTHKTITDRHGDEYECKLKIGELGCILSHRKIWKDLKRIQNQQWNIVFEDDIQIPENMTPKQVRERMNDMLKYAQENDVDVVYFGHCLGDLCTHAYAVRPKSAKILYDNTYVCKLGESMKPHDMGKHLQIDVQMRILHNKKIIKCIYAPKYALKNGSIRHVHGLLHQRIGSTIQI